MVSKNRNRGCWIAAVIAIIAVGACVIDALIPSNPITFAKKVLRVEIPNGTTVIIDNYSGASFPTGDGHSWTVLQIPPEKINEFSSVLEASPDWKRLPLPAELAEHEHYLQPTFVFGLVGEIPIADATGYYIFIDKQEEYNQAQNRQAYDTQKPFYERPSFNYRFGLFNDKDGKLYIWSLDT